MQFRDLNSGLRLYIAYQAKVVMYCKLLYNGTVVNWIAVFVAYNNESTFSIFAALSLA